MKILSVGKNARGGMFDDAMIDRTLRTSKFGDDYINDTTFISIKIQLENDDDYRAFLFRRLWECIFLKARQYSLIVDGEEGIALLKISLSEAIRMIHTMTPPALSNKLSEFTMSIDHICTVLNDFLFDPQATTYYTDIFVKTTNFRQFPFASNYDAKRTEQLVALTGNKEVCDVIASDNHIRHLININPNDVANMEMIFAITFAITSKDIRTLCNVLTTKYNVTAVTCDAWGVMVRCTTNDFQPFSREYRGAISGMESLTNEDVKALHVEGKENDYILNVIRNTYRNIIG